MLISFVILFSLAGFLLLLSCFSLFIHKLFHGGSKSNNPGPSSYPLVGCLISFYKNRHRLLHWYTELLAESPSQTIMVRRFGARQTIVTANPANVEYILKTNFNNYPKGKPFTEILGDLLGCGIFNVDGEPWSTQRKLASHEFSTKSLREFVVKTLEAEVKERLVPLLESAMRSNQVVDLQELFRRFAFDVVCKVSLGTDPGCLHPSLPVSPLVRAFDVASEISARRATAPVFAVWKIKRALRIGSEKRLRDAVQHVHESVAEIIRNKNEKLDDVINETNNGDLLSRLLSAGHDEGVTRDMVISFIMAGRDTTSAAMTWLFWLLSGHPNIEKDLLNEVLRLTNDERSLDLETLKEMRLLKASLCESMRLYPPVAWDSKHAVADDTLPDGTPVRRGDRITYFPYGMGRMEGLWGKDRLEFKPDRWFTEPADEEWGALKKVSPYKYPVFQAGPRVCLGKEMAFIQMKYVVASILRRFELRPVGSQSPMFVPLLTAHMDGGFKVMIRERTSVCKTPLRTEG